MVNDKPRRNERGPSKGMGIQVNRTSGRILLIAAAFALFLVPVAAIAAGGFTDVEDDSVFISDIQWMKDTGVTQGCNPPTNDKYCPKNNVTREQMSAFMHRLAVNQIVDAATALEADHATDADHATLAGSAAEADNADTLDGKDSSAFLEQGDQFSTAWLIVDSDATILSQSGGFTVTKLGFVGSYKISHDVIDLQAIGFSVSSFNPAGTGVTPTVMTVYPDVAGAVVAKSMGASGTTDTDHAFSIVFPFLGDDGEIPASTSGTSGGSNSGSENG